MTQREDAAVEQPTPKLGAISNSASSSADALDDLVARLRGQIGSKEYAPRMADLCTKAAAVITQLRQRLADGKRLAETLDLSGDVVSRQCMELTSQLAERDRRIAELETEKLAILNGAGAIVGSTADAASQRIEAMERRIAELEADAAYGKILMRYIDRLTDSDSVVDPVFKIISELSSAVNDEMMRQRAARKGST